MKFSNSKSGLSLIELLVTISIMTILMTTMFIGRSKYTDRLNLKIQAYDLVSTIRQAQAYSLAVKADDTGNFNTSYGIDLDKDETGSFIFFMDKNGNGKIKLTGVGVMEPDEIIETRNFSDGFTMQTIGVWNTSTNNYHTTTGVNGVDIVFKRPNPNAIAHALNNGDESMGGFTAPVQITLRSPAGSTMVITIELSGQVSIQ